MLLCGGASHADMATADRHVQKADLVGQGRMKVMLWKVFDASLYAPNGQYSESQPFALSLSYLRKLEGRKIVSKTIEEMTSQNKFDKSELTDWQKQLSAIIADVDAGTIITGIRDENGHTLFYRDGQAVGQIANERFTRGFFDIWLGETTSEPQLRNRLLGLKSS